MSEHYHSGFFSDRRIFWGLIIIIIGVLLLLNNIDAFDLGDFIADFWPVLLILLGLRLILRTKHDEETSSHVVKDRDIVAESNEAYYSNVFGDFDVAIISKDFQSGKINNVFGDAEVDLTNLDITSGEKKLNISGVFGDNNTADGGVNGQTVGNLAGCFNLFYLFIKQTEQPKLFPCCLDRRCA